MRIASQLEPRPISPSLHRIQALRPLSRIRHPWITRMFLKERGFQRLSGASRPMTQQRPGAKDLSEMDCSVKGKTNHKARSSAHAILSEWGQN